MKTLLLLTLMTVANCLSEQDSHPDFHHGSKVQRLESSSKVGSPHHLHPLPPVALPGILKEFDYARNAHQRMLLTELHSLQNRNAMLGNQIMKRKRGMVFPKRIPFQPVDVRRNKRDLRRLRRDLGYDMTFALPQYPMEKRQLTAAQIDLQTLLKNVDFLDRYPFLRQAVGRTTEPEPVGKTWGHHLAASRFAPQPILFQGETGPRPAKLSPLSPVWDDSLPRGKIMWRPSKRSANGLSMVPGFKRSSFREAERMNIASAFPASEIANAYM